MPTLNPRVNVTLSPSLDALVGRLAALQRVSKSNVLRELLETAAPALSRAVAVMEAAARSKPEVLAGLARSLEQSQNKAEALLEGALGSIQAAGDLVEQAEAVIGKRPARRGREAAEPTRGRGGKAAAQAGNPPASNRGVKSPKSPGRDAGRHAVAQGNPSPKKVRAS